MNGIKNHYVQYVRRRCLPGIKIMILLACFGNVAAAQNLPDGLINYGSNQQIWLQKWRGLAKGENHKFRIIQLGDSHTAGDYFSDFLRQSLQAKFGDGGIGWIYPNHVKGQRSAVMSYEHQGWQILTSRRDDADFPLGGVVTLSQGKQSLHLIPRKAQGASAIILTLLPPRQGSSLLVRDAAGQRFRLLEEKGTAKQWFHTYLKATPPLSFQSADGAQWALGAINIENEHKGVVYSAMGINGAQFSEVNKWRMGWLQDLKRSRADLVILAYGTNEAFNTPFKPESVQQLWAQTLNNIHQALPQAGILIIGAPESLKGTGGTCGTRAPSLDAIQNIQWYSAQQHKTLYWSWQNVMGGECSMKTWIRRKLARNDGVHFTQAGYEAAALHLSNALITLAYSR